MPQIRGRLVLADSIVDDGVVEWEEGVITAVRPATEADGDPTSFTILPGLVDVHCHGGGGFSFPDAATPEHVLEAVLEHRRHGTTSLVASLVTAPAEVLRASTTLLADVADAGDLAGIHFEGPFIARGHCGAQNPAAIVDPDPALTAELITIGRGYVKTMTIAPERPHAVDVARTLIEGGALPSWGHTDANAAETLVALAETRDDLTATGRRATVTHLFNGMAPIHHREPGPALALLEGAATEPLVVELIGDGVHLAHETVKAVYTLLGRERIVLVTDAMAAAGMADGEYVLGSLAVRVVDGQARLAGGANAGALAGGTAHLLDVVRETVVAGVPLVDAVAMGSLVPAKVLGRSDIGAIEPGRRADLLVTTGDLRPTRVIRNGKEI